MRLREPNIDALRHIFHELEFATLAKGIEGSVTVSKIAQQEAKYQTIDTPDALGDLLRRVRETGSLSLAVETAPSLRTATSADALKSRVIGIAIAVAPGEAYYLPFAHRAFVEEQGELMPSAAPRAIARPMARASRRHD